MRYEFGALVEWYWRGENPNLTTSRWVFWDLEFNVTQYLIRPLVQVMKPCIPFNADFTHMTW